MFEWFGMVSFCPHTKVADFARHLKDGRLMGSRCTGCGHTSVPAARRLPRLSGRRVRVHRVERPRHRGHLHTHRRGAGRLRGPRAVHRRAWSISRRAVACWPGSGRRSPPTASPSASPCRWCRASSTNANGSRCTTRWKRRARPGPRPERRAAAVKETPMSESPLVTLKVVDDVAFLHLDNPPVNIMSAALMDRDQRPSGNHRRRPFAQGRGDHRGRQGLLRRRRCRRAPPAKAPPA